jgi:hypothetical protein
MVVIVLSLWLTVQVAVAAEVYGAEVMGNEVYGAEVMGNEVYGAEVMGNEVYGAEVMGNEVYGAEVMGNEVMGGETGESSNWLPRLLMALGLASSAGAPSGVNYY